MGKRNDISKYSIFAKRIGLVGVAQTAISLKGLIILPILAKTIGASGYGSWELVLITVSIFQPFILLGLDNSILRFFSSKEKEEIVKGVFTAFFVILVTGTAVSLILFLSSDLLAITLLKEESLTSVVKLASSLVIITALNTIILSSFRIFGIIKRYFVIVLLQTLFEVGLIAFFVLSGYGLYGALISMVITGIVILVIELYFIGSYAGFTFPDFSILRPLLKYGLPLVPTAIFVFVISSSDRYVIGFFMSVRDVGIYSAAYGIGSVTIMFSAYLLYILRPTIYRLYDKRKVDEVKVYLSYSWKYILMFSIPSIFGLSILAEPLLAVLTTSDFISVGKFIIPLVAFSTCLYSMELIFGVVIRLFKRTNIFAIVSGTTAAINLGLNIIFIPRWGVIGAAITTLIAYAIATIIICYKSRQYMKFDIKLGFIIKCIVASGIMSFCIWVFNPSEIIGILISVGGGTIIYFSLLFLLKGFEKEELRIISESIGSRRKHK